MRLALALLIALLAHPVRAEHPYVQFENGFKYLLKHYSWHKFSDAERVRLTRMIWKGSGRDLELASTMACQGIAESHYILPTSYEKYRGYFGMHNGTLIAEAKRLHRGGKRSMWLSWSKRDPIGVSFYSASRLAYLYRCYGDTDSAVRCWVAGEGWMPGTLRYNKKDVRKAQRYLRTVKQIRDACFQLEVWE